MKTSQVRMQFMLKYEGLRIMREMQMGENPSEKRSVHEMMAEESEKTKPDGSPVTLLDLITDPRYENYEYDSDYYQSDYYYSEDDGESSEEEEDYDDEDYDDEESKSDA